MTQQRSGLSVAAGTVFVLSWLLLMAALTFSAFFLIGGLFVGVAIILVRFDHLRPWTDLAAWAAVLVVLVITPWPDRADMFHFILITAGLAGLVVALHAPPHSHGMRPFFDGGLWWMASALLVGLVAWLPYFSLEKQSLGVLDPATTAGTAIRLVVVLLVLAVMVMCLGALRARMGQGVVMSEEHEKDRTS